MKNFEISGPHNDKPNDNKQKEHRKTPRFSPITHTDQPSTSIVHKKEWVQPKGEQSTYKEKRKLIVALTMQDHLGGFLKDVSRSSDVSEKEKKAREVAEKISGKATEIGRGFEQYFDLITCYYRADAGHYTVDAGGKKSLDLLFEEETAPNCTRKFAKRTQENYDILAEAVKSIASNKEIDFK